MVMSGVPASDGSCTRARPASHVWNASVDVRRRTRRNAYTIRGAAPELNHRTSCRGSRGSASLPSPNSRSIKGRVFKHRTLRSLPQFHPGDFTQAHARGENTSRSFVDTWDFWPVLDHQVDDLRR